MIKPEKAIQKTILHTCSGMREPNSRIVRLATAEDEPTVLSFLNQRPWYTFGLLGYINSNGLVSAANRGSYYLYFDSQQNLEGVCLIGYNTIFEARSDQAIRAFAHLACNANAIHLILGEEEIITKFWDYYTEEGDVEAKVERYLLFKQNRLSSLTHPVPGLRLATLEDLDLVVTAHARLSKELSGVDGSQINPSGFRGRCARRIEQGHTWVWVEDNKLIFKIDIIADTRELIYLESMWVDPQERRKGYGTRSFMQLTNSLLQRSAAVCLLLEERNVMAQATYIKAGFQRCSSFKAIFKGAS